jgi:hypothetical protein
MNGSGGLLPPPRRPIWKSEAFVDADELANQPLHRTAKRTPLVN